MINSDLADVRGATRQLFDWLATQALPLWSSTGVDLIDGGFVERLTPVGGRIADVRRARLVARQIFVFKSAADLGWDGPSDLLVRHGVAALLDRHVSDAGDVIPRYIPSERRGEGGFDLYDHAFVLFGLAHGYAQTRDPKLEALALAILSRMREGWAVKEGGFAEHRPPQAPLKANPHMHLLEASLSWMEVSRDAAWRELRTEIVRLCLSRFIDPANGSLHEFFQTKWSVLTGAEDIVEPGHQAEWAWLLLRSSAADGNSSVLAAATRLFDIAEQEGLDRRQARLINELNADLSPRDRRTRLWPQTERIKALVAFFEREGEETRCVELATRLAQSIHALLGYFDHPVAGSWWEHFDSDAVRMEEPARASSLYHIIGAANELARLTGERLG